MTIMTDDKNLVASSAVSQSPSISFIITGFGPFRDARENPTTIISNKLKPYCEDHQILSSSRLETLIIETSVEAARAETQALDELISPEGITIVLHLGVNFMGKKFQLEQCAYNEAHFRIPDERGYQPRNKKIVEQGEATLYTRLRLEDLCSNLNLESAVVSTDPGRFVCNYTYYCSLHRFQKKMNVYTLFLHVPPFAVIPEAEQMQVVTKVMQEIEKQLTLET